MLLLHVLVLEMYEILTSNSDSICEHRNRFTACVLDLIMNDLMNELRFHQISSEYVFRHTLSCLSKESHESLE